MKKLPGLYYFTEINQKIQFYSFRIDKDYNLTHELDQQIGIQDLARFQYI